jgi:hypothetical protein
VPIVLKSGSFKLLEPSGPVQGGNGIALHTCLKRTTKNGAVWNEIEEQEEIDKETIKHNYDIHIVYALPEMTKFNTRDIPSMNVGCLEPKTAVSVALTL